MGEVRKDQSQEREPSWFPFKYLDRHTRENTRSPSVAPYYTPPFLLPLVRLTLYFVLHHASPQADSRLAQAANVVSKPRCSYLGCS